MFLEPEPNHPPDLPVPEEEGLATVFLVVDGLEVVPLLVNKALTCILATL